MALKKLLMFVRNILQSEKEMTSYQEQHALRENPDVDREYVVSNFGEIQARERYTRTRARFRGHASVEAHVLRYRTTLASRSLFYFSPKLETTRSLILENKKRKKKRISELAILVPPTEKICLTITQYNMNKIRSLPPSSIAKWRCISQR